MTNLRDPALAKDGLDYDTLSKELPNLIYCHFTAWGRQGPELVLLRLPLSVPCTRQLNASRPVSLPAGRRTPRASRVALCGHLQ